MIRSENAGSANLSGGCIVAAAGPPDTLKTLAPGKPLAESSISIPPGRAGTLALKYGPGTVPHVAAVRVCDPGNPFPRAVTVRVTGPGTYVVDHRVIRVFDLKTDVDPKAPCGVLYKWRAALATEGAFGILGALDKSHPDAKPGDPLFVRTVESAVLPGGDDVDIAFGHPMVPNAHGLPRPKKSEDEGEIVGTFEARVGDPSKNEFQIRCRPRVV